MSFGKKAVSVETSIILTDNFQKASTSSSQITEGNYVVDHYRNVFYYLLFFINAY